MVFETMAAVPVFRSRPLRAIALTLLLAVLGVASVGFATDASEPIPTEIAQFRVPAPAEGDRGLYARLLDPATGRTAGPDDGDPYTFAFLWEDDGEMFDKSGRHHWTNILRLDRSWRQYEWRNESVVAYYDQADHALVAKTWIGSEEPESDSDILGKRVHGWYGNGTGFASGEHERLKESAPCGFFTPLQEAASEVAVEWSLEHACTQVGPEPWIPRAAYAFVGAMVSDGHVYADYSVSSFASVWAEDGEHTFDERTPHLATLRFRDDIPYPVRLTYAERTGSVWENVTIVLQAFERGEGKTLGKQASLEPDLPALDLVASPAWGLDDSEFEHPYPLRDAYEDARMDPHDPSLRDFLATHDGTYVADAWFWEFERDAEVHRQWTIEVTDGVDQVTVCPYQKRAHTGTAGAPRVEVPVNIPVAMMDLFFGCKDDDRQDNPTGFEPGLRPSVASMAEIWSQVAPLFGSARPPNEYSFFVWTDAEGNGHDEISIGIDWIPQSDITSARSAVQEVEEHRITWSLEFGPDGSLEAFHTGGYLERRGEDSIIPTVSGSDPALSPSGTLVGPPIRGWEWPSPKEAGLVGVVAASFALLYLAWPWLKALLIPLFSRIDRPRALAHPKRAEIVSAVEAEPGIHGEELRRRTGLATGAFRHHVDRLVAVGVVKRRKAFGYTGYYPATDGPPGGSASVRSPTAQRILEAWRSDPSATGPDLADRLGITRQAVHYHMKRLRAAGLTP